MKIEFKTILSVLILIAAAILLSYFSWPLEFILFVLLLLPLLDKRWKNTILITIKNRTLKNHNAYTKASMIVLLIVVVISVPMGYFELLFRSLFFAAIPEEWFFRAYLMSKMGNGLKANIVSSIAFSFVHAITRGWAVGVMVFIPSLIYGWVYQKTNNIVLVITAHAISNTIYLIWVLNYF